MKDLAEELDRSKLESVQSKHHYKSKLEILETRLEDQRSEAEAYIRNIENKKTDWKVYRDRFMIERKEVPSQTDSHPDMPYLVTDALPPIFSSQLCYKSRPINFLMMNILMQLEYLAEQYDREIQEFYLDAQEQAMVKRESGQQHGQLELQDVPVEQCNQPDV